MTTASPPACQRANPRRQPATLPSSYTTTWDTTLPDLAAQVETGPPSCEEDMNRMGK